MTEWCQSEQQYPIRQQWSLSFTSLNDVDVRYMISVFHHTFYPWSKIDV